MKFKSYQLFGIGLALIALVFSVSTGIVAQANLQVSEKILADTLIGSDPFIEGLELIAAHDSALIAQYYQFGGQKIFPLNPDAPAFTYLNFMYVVSARQSFWQHYWRVH